MTGAVSAPAAPRSIGVVVCTYRRPEALVRLLDALDAQQRPADEIVLVVREDDGATRDALRHRGPDAPVRVIDVGRPGLVAARNAGLGACRTDILAFTDDDTVPRPDWLARILAHFAADPALGGLGGRDRCHENGQVDDARAASVGHLAWYGRMVGNHHRGFGPARDVHFLKGANMSYRAGAVAGLAFDPRLRGAGAQPQDDSGFSMAVRRAGWRLRYDPQVLVDHYPAAQAGERHYVGVGRLHDARGFQDNAYNSVVGLWDALPPWRRAAFLAWSLAIGTGTEPGLVQALRYTPRLGLDAWKRFLLAQAAKARACGDLLGARPVAGADRARTGRDSAHA